MKNMIDNRLFNKAAEDWLCDFTAMCDREQQMRRCRVRFCSSPDAA